MRERSLERRVGWAFQGLDDLKKAASLDADVADPLALRNEAVRCLTGVDVRKIAAIPMPLGHRPYLVAFHPNGQRLAVASLKSRLNIYVRVVEVPGGKVLHELSAFNAPFQLDGIRHIAWLSGGQTLAVTTRSGSLHRWDFNSPEPTRATIAIPNGYTDGERFAFDAQNARAYFSVKGQLYEWPDLSTSTTNRIYSGDIGWLAVDRAGRWLAASGGNLKLFDIGRSNRAASILVKETRFPSNKICVTRDGRLLCNDNGELLDIESGEIIHTFVDPQIGSLHEGALTHMQFSPSGRWFITAGRDQKLKLWDVANGKLSLSVFVAEAQEIRAAMSADEHYLAAIRDTETTLYELNSFDINKSLAIQGGRMLEFDLSPDAGTLVCAASQRPNHETNLSLWNLRSGSLLDGWRCVHAGTEPVSLAISQDAGRIAASSMAWNAILAWTLRQAALREPNPAGVGAAR